jgi:DNA-binding MarR family transcriptional regulator
MWQDRSLSKLNLHVLMLLDHHGPLTMSRLAAFVDVSLSNMTGIVDRLEQHGMVKRVRDDRDRRLVLVRATPVGTSRCEEAEGLRREHLRRLIGTLDGGERATVLQAAQAIARGVARLDAAGSIEDSDA